MQGVPYKDTFAAKGSALYQALTEGKQDEAKKIYAATTERYYASLKPKEK